MQIKLVKIFLAFLTAGMCVEMMANMVVTPSFQNGRDGWNFYDKDMSSIIKVDDSQGKFALQVDDNSSKDGSSVMSRKIKIKPGQYYKLTFYAKVDSDEALESVCGVYFVFSEGKKCLMN